MTGKVDPNDFLPSMNRLLEIPEARLAALPFVTKITYYAAATKLKPGFYSMGMGSLFAPCLASPSISFDSR